MKKKRTIPFDKPIKLAALILHVVGFSLWYGGAVLGASLPAAVPIVTIVSGVLLSMREIYQHGAEWLAATEGVLTWVKVLLLLIGRAVGQYGAVVLTIVLILGVLTSHLPDAIRERRVPGLRAR